MEIKYYEYGLYYDDVPTKNIVILKWKNKHLPICLP